MCLRCPSFPPAGKSLIHTVSWTLSHLLAWWYSWIHLDLWWTVHKAPSLHTTTPHPCTYSQSSTRKLFGSRAPPVAFRGSSTDVSWLGFDTIGHLGQGVCPSTCRDLYCPWRVPPLCESFPVLWGLIEALRAQVVWRHSLIPCWVESTKVALPCSLGLGPSYMNNDQRLQSMSWTWRSLSSGRILLFVGIVAPWWLPVCCHLSELSILMTLLCDWPCHSNRLHRPKLLSLAVWLVEINPPSGFCQTLHPRPYFLSGWKVLLGCNWSRPDGQPQVDKRGLRSLQLEATSISCC